MLDEEGKALLVNLPRRIVLASFNFRERVRSVQFSASGKYFSVSNGKHVRIYQTPGLNKTFSPFVLVREHYGHKEDVTCADWSSDGSLLLTGSKDSTARLRPAALGSASSQKQRVESERYMVTFAGHRDQLIGAFFNKSNRVIFTVAKDGAIFVWRYTPNVTKKSGTHEDASDESDSSSGSSSDDSDEESMDSDSGDSSGDEEEENESDDENGGAKSKKSSVLHRASVKWLLVVGACLESSSSGLLSALAFTL